MRILCIGRHRILSQHLAAMCASGPAECAHAVGIDEGMRHARTWRPDVVLCDVDLLAPDVLRGWEQDAVLASQPVLAVSLSRKPNEVPAFPGTPVAGFLYLPSLATGDLERALVAACGRVATAPAGAYRMGMPSRTVPAV